MDRPAALQERYTYDASLDGPYISPDPTPRAPNFSTTPRAVALPQAYAQYNEAAGDAALDHGIGHGHGHGQGQGQQGQGYDASPATPLLTVHPLHLPAQRTYAPYMNGEGNGFQIPGYGHAPAHQGLGQGHGNGASGTMPLTMPNSSSYPHSLYGGYSAGPGYGLRHPHEVDPYYVPALQASAPPSRKGSKKVPKAEPKQQPTFLTRLYDILRQPEYQQIIRWNSEGDVIIIERPDELMRKILPLMYKQSRFASFSRQLNIYGFMRKTSLRHVADEITHHDASTWAHESLRRDSPLAEVLAFKRRVPPRASPGWRPSVSSVRPRELSTPSDVSDPEDGYINLITGEASKPRVYHSPVLSASLPAEPIYWQTNLSRPSAQVQVQSQSYPAPLQSQIQTQVQAGSYPLDSAGLSITPVGTAQVPSPSLPGPNGAGAGFPWQHSPTSYQNISPHLLQSTDSSYATLPPAPLTAPPEHRQYEQVVVQGHHRTRSAYDEPITAASVWTPLALPPQLGPPISLSLDHGMHAQGEGRHVYAEAGANAQAHGRTFMGMPPNSLGSVGARMAAFSGPASVPTSFAPLAGGPEFAMPADTYAASLSESATPSPDAHPHALGGESGTLALGLVTGSPVKSSRGVGILKPFSPLHRRDSKTSHTRSPRQTRRDSLSCSPYSPRRNPLTLGQLALDDGVGGIGPMRHGRMLSEQERQREQDGDGQGHDGFGHGGPPAEIGARMRKAVLETPPMHDLGLPLEIGLGDEMDEGLPSAGVRGIGIGLEPFGNLMKLDVMDDDMW